MKDKIITLTIGALIVLFIVGCGASPTPTPAPTQPPQIITVVVTATPLPVTQTPPLPTWTPTLAVTTTATATSTGAPQPTKAAVATKPAATSKPAAATLTATALPLKYGAPTLIRPLFEPPANTGQKDEVRFDSDDIDFRWRPIDGLGGDECYLLKLTSQATNPVAVPGSHSDSFVVRCGSQPRTDDEIRLGEVRFTLNSPRKGLGPSYDSIKLGTANEMWVFWTITVVKNLGQCPADNPYRCKTAPLSPPSETGKFLFKAV